MKLWEVLKELEENPEKKFEANVTGNRAVMYVYGNYYRIDFFAPCGSPIGETKGGGKFNDNVRLNLVWKEVKQPVSWQEAIKAWMNGETISVTQKDIEKRFYEGKDYLLRDQHGDSVSEDEIAEGTWYIED